MVYIDQLCTWTLGFLVTNDLHWWIWVIVWPYWPYLTYLNPFVRGYIILSAHQKTISFDSAYWITINLTLNLISNYTCEVGLPMFQDSDPPIVSSYGVYPWPYNPDFESSILSCDTQICQPFYFFTVKCRLFRKQILIFHGENHIFSRKNPHVAIRDPCLPAKAAPCHGSARSARSRTRARSWGTARHPWDLQTVASCCCWEYGMI